MPVNSPDEYNRSDIRLCMTGPDREGKREIEKESFREIQIQRQRAYLDYFDKLGENRMPVDSHDGHNRPDIRHRLCGGHREIWLLKGRYIFYSTGHYIARYYCRKFFFKFDLKIVCYLSLLSNLVIFIESSSKRFTYKAKIKIRILH